MEMRLGAAVALLTAVLPAATHAMDEYGGGLAVPSIATTISISNDVLLRNAGVHILERELHGRSAPSAPRNATPASAFSAALDTSRPAKPAAATGFARSPSTTREAQQSILAAIAQRQPDAVAEYRRAFDTTDMAEAFGRIVKPYGLTADDAADSLTAYWVMAWIVVHDAPLPEPASVVAARDQLRGGFGRWDGGSDAHARQILADIAIFNFLVLDQARTFASRRGELASLAKATQDSFLRLGVDLQHLKLGTRGFVRG